MDPFGISLSIAGLFAASLSVLDRISAAKSYGKDYQIFITKVKTERLKLLLWGQAVGLAPATDGISASPQQLQDPRIKDAVCELLTWSIQLFEDSEKVKRRHNSTGSSTRAFVALLPGRSNTAHQISAMPIDNPHERPRIHHKASAMMKIRWAISGKRKSEKLLEDLSYFVNKLHELVPISGTNLAMPEVPEPMAAAVIDRVVTSPGTSESLPISLIGRNGADRRGRTIHFKVRRTRILTPRIVVGMNKKLKQIRVDERYVRRLVCGAGALWLNEAMHCHACILQLWGLMC